MASSAHKLAHNHGIKGAKYGFLRLGDDGEATSTTDVYLLSGTGVPSGAYNLPTGATALYARENASDADTCLYVTHNAGTNWAALADSTALTGLLASTTVSEGASLIGIQDAAGLITATTVEAALAEFALKFPLTLADPGTGAAIPVTRSASVAITCNGAETNTLAIPTFRGQQLTLFIDTDTSGARVITSAQRINQAGNTIITLADVGDCIVLEAITIAGALRWQVIANDGAALS